MTPISYKLNTYTPGAWTDLVPTTTKATVIKSVVVGVSGATSEVAIQITDGSGTSKAILVPGSSLDAGDGYTAEIPAIVLNIGERLQVKSDVSGVTFAAFGAEA